MSREASREAAAGGVALVTGAASGMGRACAVRLAEGDYHVVLCDRDGEGIDAAVAEIRSTGGSAEPMILDIADASATSESVTKLTTRLGRLDGLVHAAAVDAQAPLVDVTEEEYDRVMAINLRGAFFLVQAAGKAMADRGGAIVLFSSVLARSSAPLWSVYAMAKAGIISLTYSAAAALGPTVRVNAVCPGLIETPMMTRVIDRKVELGEIPATRADPMLVFEAELARTALKRIATADDVAGVVAFLLSSDAGYVTGQTLNVDAGLWNH